MKSPILGGSYVARSTNAADARLVNLYAEATAEGGKEAGFLSRAPGLRTLTTVGSGPIRGLWTFGQYAYVVSGLELYRMSADYGSSLLGSVTGTGPVSMTDNGIQLFIACNGPGFIYNANTGVFSVIGDPDFAGAVSVGFIDGYFVFTQPNSQIFWVTTLYDGTSIDPLDFASAEGSPDGIVGMIVDHREVWLLGTNSVEVWYDAGNTDFPLARIQGAYAEVGCAATFSVAKLDNGIFWLGSDARGSGIVYRSKGYTPVRVSTSAVEYAIQNYAVISDAVAYTYQQQGHTFYVLTFPSAGATWVYDASTDLWHERAGWGANGFMRHRSNCQMNFNNEIIVGDFETGKIYAFDLDVYTDDGGIQKWLRSWRAIPTGQNDLKRTAQHSLQLDMEVGAFNNLVDSSSPYLGATIAVTLADVTVAMTAVESPPYIFFAPFVSSAVDIISPAAPYTEYVNGGSITYSNGVTLTPPSGNNTGIGWDVTGGLSPKLDVSNSAYTSKSISLSATMTPLTTVLTSTGGTYVFFEYLGGGNVFGFASRVISGVLKMLWTVTDSGVGSFSDVIGNMASTATKYDIVWNSAGTEVLWLVNNVVVYAYPMDRRAGHPYVYCNHLGGNGITSELFVETHMALTDAPSTSYTETFNTYPTPYAGNFTPFSVTSGVLSATSVNDIYRISRYIPTNVGTIGYSVEFRITSLGIDDAATLWFIRGTFTPGSAPSTYAVVFNPAREFAFDNQQLPYVYINGVGMSMGSTHITVNTWYKLVVNVVPGVANATIATIVNRSSGAIISSVTFVAAIPLYDVTGIQWITDGAAPSGYTSATEYTNASLYTTLV